MPTPRPAPAAGTPVNVVLICVDQWRGDCLINHPVAQTPYLNGLANQGTHMKSAYVACPSCIAARASLFTGLTPASHGRVGYQEAVPWNYPVTLAGEFTRGGYQTQAVGKMHVYPARNRLGFDHVMLHDGYTHFGRRHRAFTEIDDYFLWLRQRTHTDADYFEHGLNCNSYVTRPWDKAEELHATNYVASESIDFLRRRDITKPFFLYMSFHRPHPPLDPPAWALEQYLHTEMPAAPMGDWASAFEPFRSDADSEGRVAKRRDAVRDRALAGYFGQLSHIDQQINRFVEALEEYSLDQTTMLAFVSDHGDFLGDHNLWGKVLPYEGSAHVPLFFRGSYAGIKPKQTLDIPVELRDIMPTLLDLAGLPIPESVEGQSFAPALRGEPQPTFRPYIHGEHAIYGGTAMYITDGKEKYVWLSWSGVEQLFDLRNDPTELCDLSKKDPQRLAHWRGILMNELKDRPEGFVQDGKLISMRPVSTIMPHLKAQMKTTDGSNAGALP